MLRCYIFENFGFCPFGLSCRSGSKHIRQREDGTFENIRKEGSTFQFSSILNGDLKNKLRKRKYDTTISDKIVKKVEQYVKVNNLAVLKYHNNSGRVEFKKNENANPEEAVNANNTIEEKKIGSLIDDDLIKLRPSERKQIDWKNKLYLAPLTTVRLNNYHFYQNYYFFNSI